jgi:membrane-bound metal-dependent hydrolase YbcI (DUF457 family)
MFIGHFGVGFALKRIAPRASLALLIMATVWADILWTAFLLLGWEHARISVGDTLWTPLDLYDYPCSHSLLFMALWATALAVVYRAFRPDLLGAIAVWVAVVSHWVLDWLTHRPDMPLYPGGLKHGLGLWNSISGTLVVELTIFLVGVGLYAWCTRAKDWVGRLGFWGYVAALLLLYVGDRFSGPPASMKELAISGLVGILVLIGWPWWFDRHREPVAPQIRAAYPARETPRPKPASLL